MEEYGTETVPFVLLKVTSDEPTSSKPWHDSGRFEVPPTYLNGLGARFSLAIALLGMASLPRVAVPDSRVNYLLAQHRVELAGLGIAALVAVAVALLL